jgi:hypothetical protein
MITNAGFEVLYNPRSRLPASRLGVGGLGVLRGYRRSAKERDPMSYVNDRSKGALLATLLVPGMPVAWCSAQLMPTVGPQIRLDAGPPGTAAAEVSVAAVGTDPVNVVVAWRDWRDTNPDENLSRLYAAISITSGASWGEFTLASSASSTSDFDPMSASDARTASLWLGASSVSSPNAAFTAHRPSGGLFLPAVTVSSRTLLDKALMCAGPIPGSPDTTRLYVAYRSFVFGGGSAVHYSDDLGRSWSSPTNIGSYAQVGHLPRVGPQGELHVAYAVNGSNDLFVRTSLDGGESFLPERTAAVRMDEEPFSSSNRFPGGFSIPALPFMAVVPTTGVVHIVYMDTTSVVGSEHDVDLYMVASPDQGMTWSSPEIIIGGPGDQFLPWIEADQNGRLHMVYYDSGNTAQNDNDPDACLDAYYAYSVNGGTTWHRFRLTPTSFNAANDGLKFDFIGDYLGLGVSGNLAFPAYSDTSNGDTDIYTNVIQVPTYGDIDGDGSVNQVDVDALFAAWGSCAGPDPCSEDVNGDGRMDSLDYLIVLCHWTG